MPNGNESDISLRHLRALSLLLEVRSLTKAAEIFGTSQPTMSKMLGRLRQHFADPLFVRVGLAMEPTPRAQEIATPLRGLLSVSDDLQTNARTFEPETADREFKVLVTEVGMIHLVPPLISALERAGRRLRLKAVPLDSRQTAAKLESGEADVAFGAFHAEIGNVRRQKLYADPFVSVVRAKHPRRERLSQLDAWLAERHVMVTSSSTGHAAHEFLERAMMTNLDPGRVLVRVPSFVASAFVASRTDAVSTVPAKLAGYLLGHLGLHQFKPPLSLSRIEVSQIWHERVHRDAGHRWLRSLIATLSRKTHSESGN